MSVLMIALAWGLGCACGMGLAVVICGLGSKVVFGTLHVNTTDPNKDYFRLEVKVDSLAELEKLNKVILEVDRESNRE